MMRHNTIEAWEIMWERAAENDAHRSGDAQHASATRATITTVAVMGSMAFSCLDSPSIRWFEFPNSPSSERTCDQPHSPV
jgi:hypothetical protein